jgi:oligopeptide transport system ATP-binding protein
VSAPTLEVRDVHVHFAVRRGAGPTLAIRAVDGVSFSLERGRTLALVGESGSGKSTLARAIVQLERPVSGTVLLHGRSLTGVSRRALRRERSKVQMVFQDPYGSLNPRHTVGAILAEPLLLLGGMDKAGREARVVELLDMVGLGPRIAGRYPHALSGGQRQRVAIARAIAGNPDVVVCDEAVSSLDVSVQAQILNLFERLQEELRLAYVFIAHDLAVVRQVADDVAVMYLGKIVEHAASEALYARPLHPYTRALLSAVPVPDARVERSRKRIVLSGDLPSPADPPSGCRFRTRCPWARAACAQEVPPLRRADDGHLVACHFYEEIEAGVATSSRLPSGSRK